MYVKFESTIFCNLFGKPLRHKVSGLNQIIFTKTRLHHLGEFRTQRETNAETKRKVTVGDIERMDQHLNARLFQFLQNYLSIWNCYKGTQSLSHSATLRVALADDNR